MARSLTNIRVFATSVVDGLSPFINRRGYAAMSQEAVSAGSGKGESTSGTVGSSDRRAVIKEEKSPSPSWGPDPVTGYYKPTDRAAEVDAAEIRETVLNHKEKSHEKH